MSSHQHKNIRLFTDFSAFSADKIELNRRLLTGNPALYPRRIRGLYQVPIKCLRGRRMAGLLRNMPRCAACFTRKASTLRCWLRSNRA